MTLGIVNNNLCMTSKLPIIKNYLSFDDRICRRQILMYVLNIHQCNLFTICSLINSLFIDKNNTVYSKSRISNRIFHSKLPNIVIQINSINLIE